MKLSRIASAAVVACLLAAATPATASAPVVATPATQTIDTHWAADAMADRLWVAESLTTAGVAVPANVTVIITDTDNCGSKLSPAGTGGGCTIRLSDGTISVLVSASAIENGTGEHILFHELGHALHNLGECAAEYYSHHYSNPELWSYPACNV